MPVFLPPESSQLVYEAELAVVIGRRCRRVSAAQASAFPQITSQSMVALGLVGIGHVGTTVARMARAFGMEVIATDPLLDAKEIERRGARPVSFDELIATADIVSLHCPRDASTVNLMGEAEFAFEFRVVALGNDYYSVVAAKHPLRALGECATD